jgi:hypothetical protein
MSRAVTIPLGAWPLEMAHEYAAGYCGEPSVDAFPAKVATLLVGDKPIDPASLIAANAQDDPASKWDDQQG